MRKLEVGESGISEDDSEPEFEEDENEQTSDEEYGTDQGFQPGFPTPRGAEKRNASKSESKRATGMNDGSKKPVQQLCSRRQPR